MEGCECSEEYGPCEAHGKVWAVREGASLRTADELALVLVGDLLAIHAETAGRLGSELSMWGREIVDAVEAAQAACTDPCFWLDDPDLEQSLFEVADQMDAVSGLWITREDGYVITEVIGGPLS